VLAVLSGADGIHAQIFVYDAVAEGGEPRIFGARGAAATGDMTIGADTVAAANPSAIK
jgi:hypothetical protein